jgi:dTDP-4-amino-4,6-dideoxygalactose transaminase
MSNKIRKIPFSPPDITRLEIEEVVDTLTSGWITTGPKTKLFEKQIADYCGTSKAAAMNSATACLELTLRLLGIGPGDEVITSAYTYSASASVIYHVGAKIVLVDTEKDSFHIDYEAIADAITEKTKAIIPVDIAGVMCDYDKIYDAIESKKTLFQPANEIQEAIGRVAVIGDAAHSFGASRNNIISGQAADFTCFSFHAVKNLTTSEGGAVTWRDIPGIDNEDIYREFMLLSLHGQSKDALAKSKAGSWEYDIIHLGYKFNMPDIMASIGLRQLQRYPEILEKRRRIIEMYDASFDNCDNLAIFKHYGDMFTSSGHLYLIRLLGKDEAYRNMIIKRMAEKGIATNVHFKPLPLFTAYKKLGFDIKDYPNAYRQYANEITLPLHTLLSEGDVEYICESLKCVLDHEESLK